LAFFFTEPNFVPFFPDTSALQMRTFVILLFFHFVFSPAPHLSLVPAAGSPTFEGPNHFLPVGPSPYHVLDYFALRSGSPEPSDVLGTFFCHSSGSFLPPKFVLFFQVITRQVSRARVQRLSHFALTPPPPTPPPPTPRQLSPLLPRRHFPPSPPFKPTVFFPPPPSPFSARLFFARHKPSWTNPNTFRPPLSLALVA